MTLSMLDEHYNRMSPGKNKDFRTFSVAAKILTEVGDEQGKILDIGCGFGVLVAMAAEHNRDIIGLDTSESMIQGSREYLKHLGLDENLVSVDSIEHHLEQGHQFDVITMIDVLEHIEDSEGFLKLVDQALKPSGRLVLSVPAHQKFYDTRDEMLGHHRRYSKSLLHQEVSTTSLQIQKMYFWNLLGWFEREFRLIFMSNVDTHQQYAFRYKDSLFTRFLNRTLRAYFYIFENRIMPPLGLTLIMIAQKPDQ